MGNLLANGFHLGEVIHFLSVSNLVEAEFVAKMQEGLASGQDLAGILEHLNFSKNVVTQLALVDFHGDLAGTMSLVELHLHKKLKVKKKLVQLATYPVILLIFLSSIMLGLKNYLLPQLAPGTNFATFVINHLPLFFGGMMSLILLLTVLSVHFFRRQPVLKSFDFLLKIPLLSYFIRLYLTAYFAREWGNLLKQGVDLRQIFDIMQEQQSRAFVEVGEQLSMRLNEGRSFEQAVKDLVIFLPELTLMIEYGAMKDKLGWELSVYADECWEQFFMKLDRAMQLIQPVIFIFVALMIVLLYAAMLLPIYGSMNTMM